MNYTYLRREEEGLKKERENIQYGAYFTIGLLVLVILISVLRQYALTLVSVGLVLFLQLFYFRRKQKEYKEHLQKVNLLTVIGGYLGTEELDEKGGAGLSVDTLKEANLLPYAEKGSTVHFYLGLKGKAEKLSVQTADAAITQFYGANGGKAEVNCGNWTRIKLPKDTEFNLCIYEEGVMNPLVQEEFFLSHPELKELEVNGMDSEGELRIYQKNSSREKLPERFIEKLLILKQYTPGKIALSIHGDTMDLYIRNRFLGTSYRANTEPTEQLLTRNPFPEIEKIVDLAKALSN